MELAMPKLRKMHAGYLDNSRPPTWDAILLYDEMLGIKIGTAVENTAKVKNTLCEHVPSVLADIIIKMCRRIEFKSILDVMHESNWDVHELLLSYGCNMFI